MAKNKIKLNLNLNIVVEGNNVCVYNDIEDLAQVKIEKGDDRDLQISKATLKAIRMAFFTIERNLMSKKRRITT